MLVWPISQGPSFGRQRAGSCLIGASGDAVRKRGAPEELLGFQVSTSRQGLPPKESVLPVRPHKPSSHAGRPYAVSVVASPSRSTYLMTLVAFRKRPAITPSRTSS